MSSYFSVDESTTKPADISVSIFGTFFKDFGFAETFIEGSCPTNHFSDSEAKLKIATRKGKNDQLAMSETKQPLPLFWLFICLLRLTNTLALMSAGKLNQQTYFTY